LVDLDPYIRYQIKIIKQKTEPIILIDQEISKKQQKLRIRSKEIHNIQKIKIANGDPVLRAVIADNDSLVVVLQGFRGGLRARKLHQLTKQGNKGFGRYWLGL
jgi:hypothetical protein